MKKILPIGLLVLLLYNTFGLSFAILFFEKDYQSASYSDQYVNWKVVKIYLPSLPYSGNLEMSKGFEGLVRSDDDFYNPTEVVHHNDTLYVTLKSNQAARDRFFELASAMQTYGSAETDVPQTPFGKLLKQLGNLVKDYVPESAGFHLPSKTLSLHQVCKTEFLFEVRYIPFKTSLSTPPPELS